MIGSWTGIGGFCQAEKEHGKNLFFLREASISFANRLQKYVRNVMKKHKHTQKYYAILTIEYIIRIKC